jgi:hypothetical protein
MKTKSIERDDDDYFEEWCDICGNLKLLPCHYGGDLCVFKTTVKFFARIVDYKSSRRVCLYGNES